MGIAPFFFFFFSLCERFWLGEYGVLEKGGGFTTSICSVC